MSRSNAILVRTDHGELCWLEVLTSTSGREYHVLITYGDSFPHERPTAFIVSPAIDGFVPHRYIGGALCLFPTPFDETMSTTAGVIRGRTALWIKAYETWKQTGVWPERELRH